MTTNGDETMTDQWEKSLACAKTCAGCGSEMKERDQRVLSVYTHEPICMACKRNEEVRPDYSDTSKKMIAGCLSETGKPYGDVGGYCFHHFCPYKC